MGRLQTIAPQQKPFKVYTGMEQSKIKLENLVLVTLTLTFTKHYFQTGFWKTGWYLIIPLSIPVCQIIFVYVLAKQYNLIISSKLSWIALIKF